MKHTQLEEENKTLKAPKSASPESKKSSRETTPLDASDADESNLDLSEVLSCFGKAKIKIRVFQFSFL